jgi:hypothetical protein
MEKKLIKVFCKIKKKIATKRMRIKFNRKKSKDEIKKTIKKIIPNKKIAIKKIKIKFKRLKNH